MMKSKTITSALVCLIALALLIVPAMAIPEDADYGVYRNGQWIFPPGTGEYRFNFGMSTDVPVVYGDLAAVYRGGTWIIKDGPARFQFGTPTDKPFYYDGKPAVFRDGLWIIKDGPARFNFGTTGDKPVAYGDNGAVFRNGDWIVRAADNSAAERFNFGLPTDIPVVWHDGRAAVYRDGTYIIRNPGEASTRISYGIPGDRPVTVISTEPTPLEVVSVEAITATTVDVTFAAPATADQAGEYEWDVAGVDDLVGFTTTATATVAEDDAWAAATLADALPASGTYVMEGVLFVWEAPAASATGTIRVGAMNFNEVRVSEVDGVPGATHFKVSDSATIREIGSGDAITFMKTGSTTLQILNAHGTILATGTLAIPTEFGEQAFVVDLELEPIPDPVATGTIRVGAMNFNEVRVSEVDGVPDATQFKVSDSATIREIGSGDAITFMKTGSTTLQILDAEDIILATGTLVIPTEFGEQAFEVDLELV